VALWYDGSAAGIIITPFYIMTYNITILYRNTYYTHHTEGV